MINLTGMGDGTVYTEFADNSKKRGFEFYFICTVYKPLHSAYTSFIQQPAPLPLALISLAGSSKGIDMPGRYRQEQRAASRWSSEICREGPDDAFALLTPFTTCCICCKVKFHTVA